MPVFDHIQESFLGGELSPRLRGRVSVDAYKNGCAKAHNWEPLPQGSAMLRQSTKFLSALPAEVNELSRVVNFRTKGGKDYAVILDGTNVSVFDRNGPVTSSSETEFIVNGDFAQGWTGWTWDSGTVLMVGAARMSPQARFRQITTVGPGNYILRFKAHGVFGGYRLHVTVGSLDFETYVQQSGDYEFSFTIASGGAKTITLATELIVFSGVSGTVDVDDVSLRVANPIAGTVSIASPWTATQLAALQWANDVSNDRIVFVHPNVAPRSLVVSSGTWSFSTPTLTGAPAQWAGTNWPSVIEFYQGRLWLAATPNEQNWLWGSKVTNIFDFTVGSNPGDGFEFRAATKNAFKWLRGQRTMLAGTDYSELSITAASVVVSSGDVQVREESAFGSAGPAENIGDQTVYVSADRRKLRALLFNLDTDGYVSTDLTYHAEHMTESGVKDVLWLRDPNTTLALLLDDGTMAMCSYDRQKMAAWWKWSTQGLVRSAAYSVAESATWMIVERQNGWFLEQLPAQETAGFGWNLDCADTVERVHPAADRAPTLLDNLTRFIGQMVNVTGDDVPLGQYLVDDTGSISIPAEVVQLDDANTRYAKYRVGLPYPENVLEPLPPEGGNPAGTSQGMQKRYIAAGLRLNDSALPLVNGDRPREQRTPSTPMGTAEPRRTGDVWVQLLGYKTNEPLVTITQDLPLRTEVCAVFGTIAQNKV